MASLATPREVFSLPDDQLSLAYSFDAEIGSGNWGSIWRVSCSDPLSSPSLAIKLVHRNNQDPTTPAKIKSLWVEFKILSRFKHSPHKNILAVASFIISPSCALLTMQLHPAPLPIRIGERNQNTLAYAAGLLSGLAFLHSNRVSHNDIKPANVVLSQNNDPVLIDFGFAVSYASPTDSSSPDHPPFWSSLSWGTPEYLSPQRAKGLWHDERLSDIWSLGVTIYEMVVGRTPFEADGNEQFLSKDSLDVYYQRTLKAEFLGPHNISHDLRTLLIAMVRPQPEDRIQSCNEALQMPYFTRALHSPDPTSAPLTPSCSPSPSGSIAEPDHSLLHQNLQQLTVRSPTSPNSKRSPLKPKIRKPIPRDLSRAPSKTTLLSYSPTKPILLCKSVNTPTRTRSLHKRVPVPKYDCFQDNKENSVRHSSSSWRPGSHTATLKPIS